MSWLSLCSHSVNLLLIIFSNLLPDVIHTLPQSSSPLDMWVESSQVRSIISYMGQMYPKGGVTDMEFTIRCNTKSKKGDPYDSATIPLPQKIYYIYGGEVMKDILDKFKHSYTIPPQISTITLAWKSAAKAQYYFIQLRSLDRKVMHDPLLNIPQSGIIPTTNSFFTIALSCTKRVTSIVHFQIEVRFVLPHSKKTELIRQTVKKLCLSSRAENRQVIRCFCRERCARRQRKNRRRGKKLTKEKRAKYRRNCYRKCRSRCRYGLKRRNCMRRANRMMRRRRLRRLRHLYTSRRVWKRQRRWLRPRRGQ